MAGCHAESSKPGFSHPVGADSAVFHSRPVRISSGSPDANSTRSAAMSPAGLLFRFVARTANTFSPLFIPLSSKASGMATLPPRPVRSPLTKSSNELSAPMTHSARRIGRASGTVTR